MDHARFRISIKFEEKCMKGVILFDVKCQSGLEEMNHLLSNRFSWVLFKQGKWVSVVVGSNAIRIYFEKCLHEHEKGTFQFLRWEMRELCRRCDTYGSINEGTTQSSKYVSSRKESDMLIVLRSDIGVFWYYYKLMWYLRNVTYINSVIWFIDLRIITKKAWI